MNDAVPFPEPIEGYSVPDTGLVFYGDPTTLTEAQIDPLLWSIVQEINASGWVWTAEACQGHPEDATEQGPWAGNHRAMIRLVCRIGDLGRLLTLVAEAAMPVWDADEFSPLAWEPWVQYRPHEAPRYAEALIYMGRSGQHVGGRDRAIRAWHRFAALTAIQPAEAAIPVPDTGASLDVEALTDALTEWWHNPNYTPGTSLWGFDPDDAGAYIAQAYRDYFDRARQSEPVEP